MNARILMHRLWRGLVLALTLCAHGGGGTSTVGFVYTNYFVPEGLSSPSIALTRDGDVANEARVSVRVGGGTATPESDFTLNSLVTFEAGQTKAFLALVVRSDGVEPEETIELALTDLPQGMAAGDATATIHILAQPLTLRWSPEGSPSNAFVDESAAVFNMILSRLGTTELRQRIRVRSVDGSAKAGMDYEPVDQVLEFGPGIAELPVSIRPINDAVKRGDRGFRLVTENLSPEVVLRTLPSASVTLVDNDLGYKAFSGATSTGVRETEPNGIPVTVTRQGDFGPSTIDYYTLSGTAIEGVDFVASRGTLTFDGGLNDQSRIIVIPLLPDTAIEPTERFRLVLTNAIPDLPFQPGFARVLTLQIADVPAGYRFVSMLDNPSQNWVEASESATEVRVAVRRVGYPDDTTGSVRFSTEDGTATAGQDYEAVSGRLEFPPGTTEQWITVPLIKDGQREGMETFRIRLSDAVGAAPIVNTNLTVRILDDDPGFAFQYTPSIIGEQFPAAVLVVQRGSDPLVPVSVRFQTEDGTAKAGLDYVATQGTLEFAAGEMLKEIQIPILNDALSESGESFRVRLLEPSAATSLGSPASATVMIQDNELGYQAVVASSVSEGNGDWVFRVDRLGDFVSTSSVRFRVVPAREWPVGNWSSPGVPGVDFTPITGQLTFSSAVTSHEVRVPNLNDRLADGPKSIRLELFDPVGEVPVASAFVETTVYDNEIGYGSGGPLDAYSGLPVVTEVEGSVALSVSRLGDFDVFSTVDYEIGSGKEAVGPDLPAAVAGRDFEPTVGTLTFAPGQTNATFTVTLHADGRGTGDKALTVSLRKASQGVPIATPSWTVLIRGAKTPLARVDPEFLPTEGRLAASMWSWNRMFREAIVPLADGRVLTTTDAGWVGRSGGVLLVRLGVDGAMDPSFQPFENAWLWSATRQGVIHVVGADGGLLRLDASGRVDPTFSFPPSTNNWVRFVASREDGGGVVVLDDQNGGTRLVVLRSDGKLAPGFAATPLGSTVHQALPLASGGVALRGDGFVTDTGRPLGAVAVLGPDGKLIPPAAGERRLLDVEQLVALPNGRFAAQGIDPDSGERGFFRLTPTGAIDPDFTPIRGWFVFATDADHLWLLRINATTGRHWLERRLLDGSSDPTATSRMVELDLLDGGRVGEWVGGGGLAATPVSVASPGRGRTAQRPWKTGSFPRPSYPNLPSIAADRHGGLFLGNVARINGHLRRGLARVDLGALDDRLEPLPSDARLAENSGRATLTLVRTGDLNLPRSFRWNTSGGTAVAGVNYERASGTLDFATGQPSAAITLTLLDNTALDTDRSVRLAITDANGGVLPPVEITIVNDDLGFLSPGILPVPGGAFLLRPTGHLIRRDGPSGTSIPSAGRIGAPSDAEYSITPWTDEVVIWPDNSGYRFLRLRQ